MKDTRLLHVDSEFGKIVVNECLKRGYEINTKKLENLLVIIHGKLLAEYDKPLLKTAIFATEKGIRVPQIEENFIMYCVKFEEMFDEYIPLLDCQRKVIKQTIVTYGQLNALELIEKTSLQPLNEYCLRKGITQIPNEIIKTAFSSLIWLDEEKSI